jgi:hypothetical protein
MKLKLDFNIEFNIEGLNERSKMYYNFLTA